MPNCEQVGQIIFNEAGGFAQDASTYADFWRFVLVNYNGGPGCLTEAIRSAWMTGMTGSQLGWNDVAENLPMGCSKTRQYVDNVAR